LISFKYLVVFFFFFFFGETEQGKSSLN
jgi:hypothetical protein